MESMNFDININAPKEKVWNALWEDANYRDWTSAFSETSYVVTDWKQGSKVLFLDGTGCGMVSRIAESRPNEYMSFEHLGEVRDGVEDTTSEKVQGWKGARENYTLIEKGNSTDVKVELTGNIPEEHKDYFVQAWPKALNKLKQIAESN